MSTTQERLDRQLLNACRYGHVSEVDILLSKGADIHYSDEDDPFGATCLSEASRRGKAEIVQLLIDGGVSVNDKISHDITALHLACERGHISVVSVLLSNDCDACPAELFNLDTPLHYAAANDHDNICKLLFNVGGVNVNIQNRTGDTALHISVANDRLKSTTMLLSLGADLSLRNYAEMTPIIVAQLAKCKHAIEAMQPFIDKLRQNEETQHKKQQEKLVQSRKNTIKKTLDLSSHSNANGHGAFTYNDSGNGHAVILDETEAKYDYNTHRLHSLPDNLMSGKRDVVFKKGFLQKQGKKFKHFHVRYFILWSNGLMNYYSKEHTIFANYAEKSKEQKSNGMALRQRNSSHSGDHISVDRLTMQKSNSLSPSPVTTSKCEDNLSMAFEDVSGDETGAAATATATATDRKKKKKLHIQTHRKRKSTLRKLGLKSDVIKPKGIIDINDLIETQFLEFASDNTPGWALITAEREWKFKCKNDRERREWIAAVHAVNYGISPFDFENLDMNISYTHNNNCMLLEPSTNQFITQNSQLLVAQGWMFKLGAAVRGLEQNYWKKRWVSLYKKPARLAYAQHPYSSRSGDIESESALKGVIQLNNVTNIIKIGNNNIIKHKYRAPTVHVFALITEKRTWVFSCKTAEECTMWHDRISFFLPNQWKKQDETVNVEELLRFNRVKTIANENDIVMDNQHLNVKNKNKDKTDDTVMSKLFRKVSAVAESLGVTEQYSTISGVQPKGTITDYDDAVKMIKVDHNQ